MCGHNAAMTDATMAVICLLILGWAVTSQLLSRHDVTGPLVFVVAGYGLANPTWGVLTVDVDASMVHTLAELALGLVLFTDASRVSVGRLRAQARLPARLLLIGLPLTILVGTVGAQVVFGEFGWALALFVGASLAPTDAALSVQVINDKRIPRRLRLTLNVESGLNDGIATPVVTLAIALSASALGMHGGEHITVADAVIELLLGLGIGLAGGFVCAWAINLSVRHGLSSPATRRIAALATAAGIFALAIAIEGNGFIAAFVAGMAFGHFIDRGDTEDGGEEDTDLEVLPELGGELLALVVWFLFGAGLIPLVIDVADAGDLVAMLGYAALSLTVFRMLPVAMSLIGAGVIWPARSAPGAGLPMRDVALVGWFGPRGLASVVFALLGFEELGDNPTAQAAVAAIGVTVLASVILHGVSAGPLARRYPSSAAEPSPTTQSLPLRSRTRFLRRA